MARKYVRSPRSPRYDEAVSHVRRGAGPALGPGWEVAVVMAIEEHIGTVNVWELHQIKAPLMRVLARHSMDHLELEHSTDALLKTKLWNAMRVVPHCDAGGHPSDHIYDLYGQHWQTPD